MVKVYHFWSQGTDTWLKLMIKPSYAVENFCNILGSLHSFAKSEQKALNFAYLSKYWNYSIGKTFVVFESLLPCKVYCLQYFTVLINKAKTIKKHFTDSNI